MSRFFVLTLAVLVTIGASVSARAETVFTNVPATFTGGPATVFTDNGVGNPPSPGAPDGNLHVSVTNATGAVTLHFGFSAATEGRTPDLFLPLLSGTTAGVTITKIVWNNTAGGDITYTPGAPIALPSGGGLVKLYQLGGTPSGVNPYQWDEINITFAFANAAATLEIDTVANPEPGTMALFGLGALGLAGLVRRRRKAKTVSAT